MVPEPCAICLEPLSERVVAVPCNHLSFDFDCLVRWIQESAICPLCKSEVSALEYDWAGPDDYKTYHVSERASSTSSGTDRVRNLNQPPSRPFVPRRARPPRPPRRRPAPPVTPDVAVLRRRYVYQHKLYSLHVGANRRSAYTNLTPAMIKASADLQSRARAFTRRELAAFPFLYRPSSASAEAISSTSTADGDLNPPPTSPTTEFLIPYVVSILSTIDVKGASGAAEDMLADFLGRDHARLFWHEMSAWLRSPFVHLRDWDRAVQYREPLPDSFGPEGQPIWTRGRRPPKPRRTGRGDPSRVADDEDGPGRRGVPRSELRRFEPD